MGNYLQYGKVNSLTAVIVMLFMAMASIADGLENDKPTPNEQEIIHVAFINPAAPGNAYWDNYMDYMKIASKSLNINVDVKYADDNRLISPRLAREFLDQTPLPDYLMYIYQHRQSADILALAEAKKVKSFVVNTGVLQADKKNVGSPRGKFDYWIGHFHPDNVAAGERLINGLVSLAHERGLATKDGRVLMLGFSGSRDSTASLDYIEGLERALKKHQNVDLQQLVFTNWSYTTACRQAEGLLLRYPETTLMWSIGEDVALGILCGAKKAKRKPGVDLLVGGTVSSKRGVSAIEKGQLIANMGGDTWEGANALVMLYDYHHGFDFTEKDYTVRYYTQLVTQENVAPYVQLISERKWRYIDYKQLSRVHRSNHQPIEFNVQTLLDAMVMPTDKPNN